MKRKTSILVLLACLLTVGFFSSSAFAFAGSEIGYQVRDVGGQMKEMVGNGVEAGGTGTISAFNVDLGDELKARGSIQYRIHSENKGWSDWANEGQTIGDDTNGIQAIRMKLTGQLPYYYEIFYRVHVPGVGWSGWGNNGTPAGSEGFGRNISILQIYIAPAGKLPPGGTLDNVFNQTKWAWPVPGYTGIASDFGPRWGTYHDGIDIPAPAGTPIVSCKNGVVKMANVAGGLGNCVCVQNDSGENVYYAHMSRFGCKVNDRVQRGQVIGFVGTTGHSDGNHLHIEIYNAQDSLTSPWTYLR